MSVNGTFSASLGNLLTQEFDSEFTSGQSQFSINTPFTGSVLAQGGLRVSSLGTLRVVATGATPLSNLIFNYMISLLPPGWFGWLAPVRDVVVGGVSDALAAHAALLQAVRNQTRVSTSTGWLLDLTAWDFFGIRFRRFTKETDASFRLRVVQEVIQERVSRDGVSSALARLTGSAPRIFEPFNVADCGGGYGSHRLGYGRSGRYGSVSYSNQLFISAGRPAIASIPNVPGYRTNRGGYRRPPATYASLTEVQGPVQDADIIQCVKNNVAAGVVGWLSIGAISVIDPFKATPSLATDDTGSLLTTDNNSAVLTPE